MKKRNRIDARLKEKAFTILMPIPQVDSTVDHKVDLIVKIKRNAGSSVAAI
jgi:hypothetical protein